jgi:Bacteriophage head to tail connecting protein
MNDILQDEALVKADLRNHDRLKEERSPWETLWQEIDELFPNGAGGFLRQTPGNVRGEGNFDTTHITALGRFAAAMTAITLPEEKQYIKPRFADPELMKIREVKLWCERAGQRLYDIRYAALTGFGMAANEDFDQLGRYGTSPVWQEALPGRGLIYRTLHLAECYIDTDAAGLVDTVHRAFEKTARECEQMFGLEALTPKMRECLATPGKEHTKFQLVHIVMPNTQWDEDKMDWRRMPIASRYLAVDEKMYLRRSGFNTMPISVSRHLTSPMEKYGRSPAINKLATIRGLQAMRHTTLRAGHKAVDPALIFFDDDGITSISSKPGGMNPGLVSEDGRVLVSRMPGGENGLPYAQEMIADERVEVRSEFLEEFYKILTDPNSRMTTTEVLEVMGKQGILVRPYANRYRTEKQAPMCARDLDLALRAGQIEDFPPEVQEAGAWPIMDYDNPLSAMAKAEEAGRTMRFVEVLTPWGNLDNGAVFDYIDTDELVPGLADAIGVPARYVRSKEQVAAMRGERADAEQAAAGIDALGTAAGAFKDIAQGNAISEAA